MTLKFFGKKVKFLEKKVESFLKFDENQEKISLFWRFWSIFSQNFLRKVPNSPKWPLTPLIQNEKYQSTFRYLQFLPTHPFGTFRHVFHPEKYWPPPDDLSKSVFWPEVLQSANIFVMEAFYLVRKCCVLRLYSQLTAGQNLNVLRAISDF